MSNSKDTKTDVDTSGKSITLTSTRNNLNIESEIKNIDVNSYRNINLNSDIDSVNIDAHHCINVNSLEKSINLYSEQGKISSISYDDTLIRSIHGDVIIKSDRKALNLESFENLGLKSKQGNLSIETPNGDINIRSSNNINITPGPESQVYVAGNLRATTISQGSASSESGLLVPTGSIMAYCGLTSPTGWFICDGSTYDKITYRDLYLVIGNTFGGSGSNFAVPDMRGRTIVGSSNQIQNITDKEVGDIGGAETHTLTIEEMPAHTHDVNTDISGWSSSAYNVAGAPDRPDRGATNITTTSTGGGLAHSIMQPYMTLNYIIKY